MYEDLQARIEGRLSELIRDAEITAGFFYSHHHEGNSSRPIGERSRLGVRVRKRNGYMEINWIHLGWKRVKGRNLMFSAHIPKGRNHCYRMQRLISKAQDWEVDHVIATEKKLAVLREEYAYLMKTKGNLARAAAVRGDG